MPDGIQNFFHANHPIDKVDYPDFSVGFDERRQFCVDRGDLGTLKVDYKSAAHNPDAPIAVIMHGYRGNPDGPNNKALTHILDARGFATAQVGFAGYDHYGLKQSPKSADDASIPSNTEDIRLLLDGIGSDRKIVLIANSASINAALPAANENVSHILGVSPFPNIVTMLAGQIRQRGFTMPASRYLIDPDNPSMKITQALLDAKQDVNLIRQEELRAIEHKPRLMTMRAANDYILPKGLIMKFLDAAHDAGYVIEDYTVDTNSHALTGEMFAAFGEQVDLIAQDLGVEPA